MKYSKRLQVWLPKTLLDDFDRRVLADGRRRGEVVRTLIIEYLRENKDSAGGAARGAARGSTS